MSRRFLRYPLLVVLALVLVVSCYAYWTGYRVLPQVDGEDFAPGLRQAGAIQRDQLGIPTITAANAEDALFLQGYAAAQDRLFQMDALRRKAAGELSEVVGPGAIELDMESRKLRLKRIATMHARTLNEQDRAHLSAYARGVNHYIRTHREKLPMEFSLLGYDPAPWTIADSILIGLEMYRSLTTTWKSELQKAALLSGGAPKKVDLLYPPRTGGEISPGSNAWVISGKHSATGQPLLSNDPHLQWTLPSTWHAVRIQSPDLHVAGVSLPGVPGVIVGHNEQIAWGVTNLGFDVQDLYDERADLNALRYEYQGVMLPVLVEREAVAVRGQRVYTLDVLSTRHGPLVVAPGQALALRWTAAEPGSFQFPFIDLNRAQNWDQFRAALKRFPGPGQNFVYADKSGNIGYQATGMLPVRKPNHGGDLPAAGWTGENEWAGFIPFEELPSSFNPADGYVVTANQNPFPKDYKYPVHGDFSTPYRANQIRALLRAREGWKPEEMTVVQKDVYSAFSHFLARQLVQAFDKRKPTNPSLPAAITELRTWNGQMERGQSAPLIVSFVYQRLKRKVVDRVAPGHNDTYQDQMSTAVLDKLLRERPRDWFEDWDKTLIASLDEAIEDIRRQQGSDVAAWRYGRYNDLTIPHPVLGRIPFFGEWMGPINVGPVEMAGSSTTVKQTGKNIGPSMRFTADLADFEHSQLNLTIGESGNLFSPHYRDQWDLYWQGRSTPFAFDKPEAVHTLRLRPPQQP